MELLDGGTLRERIAGAPLDLGAALALSMGVLDALDTAHAKGIVHCDITSCAGCKRVYRE